MSSITIRFSQKADIAVSVTLDDPVPPVTDEKDSTPNYGYWTCTSQYLGKKSKGLYYITRLPEQKCTKEQSWAGLCTRNPYAFFFDTADKKTVGDAKPFMVCDNFGWHAGVTRGVGKLLAGEFSPGFGLIFDWEKDQS